MEACRKTSGDFTAGHLANFIDNSFYQVSATTKEACDGLIRSVESCRSDLRRWDARFEANSQRPYFEGHERPDVVIDRRNFIDKFLKNKHNYYLVSDGDDPTWIMPTQNPPTILICQSDIRQSDFRLQRLHVFQFMMKALFAQVKYQPNVGLWATRLCFTPKAEADH
jgi:hypothetical protein